MKKPFSNRAKIVYDCVLLYWRPLLARLLYNDFACAHCWWQQKASWPKFDYKVVSILTETFFLGKHFGRIFTLKVSLNIHFRRKSIKLTGISNFVGSKKHKLKKSLGSITNSYLTYFLQRPSMLGKHFGRIFHF